MSHLVAILCWVGHAGGFKYQNNIEVMCKHVAPVITNTTSPVPVTSSYICHRILYSTTFQHNPPDIQYVPTLWDVLGR